jgi:hypothetical protein
MMSAHGAAICHAPSCIEGQRAIDPALSSCNMTPSARVTHGDNGDVTVESETLSWLKTWRA